jgi:hypothetical protein
VCALRRGDGLTRDTGRPRSAGPASASAGKVSRRKLVTVAANHQRWHFSSVKARMTQPCLPAGRRSRARRHPRVLHRGGRREARAAHADPVEITKARRRRLQKHESPPNGGLASQLRRYSGGGIRTRDLRVMSPCRAFVGTRWSSSAPGNPRVGSDRVGLGSVGYVAPGLPHCPPRSARTDVAHA